jgi:hypothetical protein
MKLSLLESMQTHVSPRLEVKTQTCGIESPESTYSSYTLRVTPGSTVEAPLNDRVYEEIICHVLLVQLVWMFFFLGSLSFNSSDIIRRLGVPPVER